MASNNDDDEKHRLIIGIDYGTTYTGVAYADSRRKEIQVVTSWPGKAAADNEKVPSQISYGNYGPPGFRWGQNIPKGASRHFWTKLELDKDTRSHELRQLLAIITGDLELLKIPKLDEEDFGLPPSYPGKTAKDMVADYLSGVKEHLFNKILVPHYGKAVVDTLPIGVIMTCPAVWSDRAKELTFQAASAAGFGDYKISMLTEPEAAAIHTVKDFKDGLAGELLKVDDYFVVCDAGGGTVDLISYKVTQVNPTLQVEEAAVGTGDKCGATFVDREFRKWLQKKLGNEVVKKELDSELRIGGRMMDAFDSCKRQFDGDDDWEDLINLPGNFSIRDDDSLGISSGTLTITSADMKDMFEPHVARTIELLEGQIQDVEQKGKPVSWVFLVGGFAKSDYLFQKVESWCKSRNIQLIRPANAWSAIVRGAVARGLEGERAGLVSMRLCRRHYGTPVSRRFDPDEHLEEDRYIDEFSGKPMAGGQMLWLLAKGDVLLVTKSKEATITVTANFKKNDERISRIILAACNEPEAPSRYAENSVYHVCHLDADISDVPDDRFLEISPGRGKEPYFAAHFKISLILTQTRLEFKCLFDGQECGSVKANYS